MQCEEHQKKQGKSLSLSLCDLTARKCLNWYRYTKCQADLVGHEHVILFNSIY